MKLELTGVRYPLDPYVLELDLVIRGRVTAVFGPSGAGKTTVLDLVAGLKVPSAGRIRLGERLLTDIEAGIRMPSRHRRIGYVVQDGALFPHLRVRRNLLYGQPRSAMNRSSIFDFDHVVEVLELSGLLDRSVAGLSGGERQRVALGRALISRPDLLLLDEPLGSLDRKLKARIIPYLIRVRDEFTIPMLVVTHAPDEVAALCDQVVLMDAGRVAGHGSPSTWFEPDPEPGWRRRETG